MGSPPPPPRPLRERRAPGPIRWGIGDAVLAFVLATVGAIVAEGIALAVTGVKHVDANDPPTSILFALVVGQYGAWFAYIAVASRFKGLRSLRADFGFVVDIVRDWPVIAIGFGFEIAAGIIIFPITHLVHHTPQEVVHELDNARGAKLVVLVLTAVVVAPVVEELFFRGLLLRSLQRRMPAAAAVTVAALAFGVSHIFFDFGSGAVLPALVALGMLSGIFAVRTGNLSRSVLLHAGFNLVAVLAVLTNH